MITYFQAVIIGLLQGASELFPVSSLGHSVILPKLLGWQLNQQDPAFLTLLVALHFATALVLIGFFWKDWVKIVRAVGHSFLAREIKKDDVYARIGWLLIVGTVPAAIIGLLFQETLAKLFASASIAAFFLIVNGLMLYGAEQLRKKAPVFSEKDANDLRISQMSWLQTIGIGAAQALALIPGFSRSGATMSGGLLVGLSNEDAARFSFLLATPIILAASLLKLPDLFKPEYGGLVGPALVGAVCAGLTAYFSVRFLLRFFETNRLTPFAIYCICAGIIFSLILL